ncbi:MAG TPA: M28 family peptidase [Candidatus Acidoferrum sp.]|nr:M28 family peptidase [Candidatus Acidoferrum sp.]
MTLISKMIRWMSVALCICAIGLAGCKASGKEAPAPATQPPFMSAVASAPPQSAEEAPTPEKTGGFDGKRAFAHVARQVSFGPRPSGSPAMAQMQDYLLSELKSDGCTVETDPFSSDTPIGRVPMKNILVKIPGEKPAIIMLATHYDTARSVRDPRTGEVHPMPTFVGADDGGSSTGLMLELARLLCPQHGKYAVWIAFFDGEEAMHDWSDTDSRYGSRQMAAKLAMSGDLKKVKGLLLADIVGGRTAVFKREASSTPALVDLMWNAAAKLGYSGLFSNEGTSAQDDHDPFLKRNVPSVDVIGDFINNGYWHTPQDTLDKISAKTLAGVGHVFLESVKQLQAK